MLLGVKASVVVFSWPWRSGYDGRTLNTYYVPGYQALNVGAPRNVEFVHASKTLQVFPVIS